MGAISAGIGVVSGIAGMSAKNKEAAAQAQAAADQRFQAQASAWAQRRTLEIQAETTQQQHSMSTIQMLSDYSMREAALKAQRLSSRSEATQRDYGQNKQAIEAQTALAAQVGELNAMETGVLQQYQQQAGASDVRDTQLNEQLRSALQQTNQQLDQQRKQQSLVDASRRPRSGGVDRKTVVEGLTQLLEMDQTQAASMLQNINETDMADIAAVLGLSNVDFGRDNNALNQRVVGEQQAYNQRDSEATLELQQKALDTAQLNELTNYALSSASNQRTYDANRSVNTTQQQAGVATANSVDASLKRAQDAPRGASFLDALNVGVSAYQGFSPYFGTRTSTTNNMGIPTTGGVPIGVYGPSFVGPLPKIY